MAQDYLNVEGVAVPLGGGGTVSFESAVLATSPTNFWPMTEGAGTPVDIVAGRSTTMQGLSWLPSGGKIDDSPVLDFVADFNKWLVFSDVTDAGNFTWQVAARFDSVSTQMMLARGS